MIKKRQVYDPEFKREAVHLAQQRGVPALAADLGLRANTLYRWKQEFEQDSVEAFPGCGHLKAEEEELRRLRREHEAHRVLKANGTLIDLRPAAVHRRVGLVRAGGYQHAGTMREPLDDDRAANRAIAQVLRSGLYRAEWRTQFECRRVMDSLDDFRLTTSE